MRYNSYRQYVTLNGVKRENKIDVLKNLKSYYKNIMRYIPKAQYEKFIQGHDNITYRFIVNPDNTLRSLRLIASDTVSGSLAITDAIEINIPVCSVFNGAFDGTSDDNRRVIAKYYTESEQQLTVVSTTVGTTGTYNVQSLTGDYHGPFIDGPSDIVTVASSGNTRYYIRIPGTMKFSVIDLDVTGLSYDSLPIVPITYFE